MKAWTLVIAALLCGVLVWLALDEPPGAPPAAVSGEHDSGSVDAPVLPSAPDVRLETAEPTALHADVAEPPAATEPAAAPGPPARVTLFLRPDGTPAVGLELEFETLDSNGEKRVSMHRSDDAGRVPFRLGGWPESFAWRCVDPTLLLFDLGDVPLDEWFAQHALIEFADRAVNRLRCHRQSLRGRDEQRLLVIPSTTSLSGTVLGPDGTPRAELRLNLWNPMTPGNRAEVRSERASYDRRTEIPDARWWFLGSATTNAEGRFHFPHVPTGELRLTGSFALSDDDLQVVAAALVARADEHHDLGVLPLGRDRAPVPLWMDLTLDGVPVVVEQVWQGDEPFQLAASLDDVGGWPSIGLDLPLSADTRARVFGLPDATWQLTYHGQLTPGGFVPPFHPELFTSNGPLLTLPRDELRVRVRVFTWIPITLEVSDLLGLPAGAEIELEMFGADLGWWYGPVPHQLPIDAQRPTLALPAGRYVILARGPRSGERVFGVARVEVTAPGPVRAAMVLSAAGRIDGRLVGDAGEGLARRSVQLWPVGSPTDAPTGAVLATAFSDENGDFRFTGVPARTRVELRIASDVYDYAQLGEAFETPAHGDTLRLAARVVPENLR